MTGFTAEMERELGQPLKISPAVQRVRDDKKLEILQWERKNATNPEDIKALDKEIGFASKQPQGRTQAQPQSIMSQMESELTPTVARLPNQQTEQAQRGVRTQNDMPRQEPRKLEVMPLGEVALTQATRAGSAILGGLQGAYTTARLLRDHSFSESMAGGLHAMESGKIGNIQHRPYEPDKGTLAETINKGLESDYNPLTWPGKGLKKIGEVSQEMGASPGFSTAIETGGNALLLALGGKAATNVPIKAGVALKTEKPRLTYREAQEQIKERQGSTPEQFNARNAREAQANGFVITPRQASPRGTMANVYEGAAGSAKTEKLASVKNEANASRLIATEDLGLKPNQQITTQILEDIRAKEGKAYEAVKNSGVTLKTNDAYGKAIENLGGDIHEALPGVIKRADIDDLAASLSVPEMSATTAIATVKILRADATKNIKAGFQSPEREALGYAQRKAANAIDQLIEDNLAAQGKGNLATAYKKARVKIAQTHDIEKAFNDVSGHIDPNVFAKLLDKGVPLSGGMLKVAKFAKSFKGAARNIDNMKDAANFDVADLALGILGGSVHPGAAVAAVSRPVARSVALSKLGQKVSKPSKRLADIGR